ncbi:MAG: glycosyltransferase family 4 protein [Pseudooceanicola nanhaiensis]
MKVGLVTELDMHRKDAWSGTILYMAKALRDAGAELEYIGPVWQRVTVFQKRLDKLLRRVTGRDPMFKRSRLVSRLKGRTLARLQDDHEVDILFAPVGSTLIADLPQGGKPLAYSSDATVRLMMDYYDWYGDMTPASRRKAIASEAAAMERADLLIYPTQWAARSAVEDYGIDPARIMVQPFGPNLADVPDRAEALAPRAPGPVRLLFCGVEWERKGGDLALDAAEKLIRDGVEVELTILGCRPPAERVMPDDLRAAVTVIPYLNKALPEEYARFREIFGGADILILPTRADCYGMVFCEASAFGVVSVSTITGGVPEVIRHDETGFTLPLEADGAAYAEVIRGAIDSGRLEEMKIAARDDFESRLNWNVWAKAVMARIDALGPQMAGERDE